MNKGTSKRSLTCSLSYKLNLLAAVQKRKNPESKVVNGALGVAADVAWRLARLVHPLPYIKK